MRNIISKRLLLLLFCMTTINICLYAQPSSSKVKEDLEKQPANSPNTIESENNQLQRDRLAFDKEKFGSDKTLEESKIKIEQSKLFWSSIATAIPLVLGILTIAFGIWSQYQQAKLQFDIKVAEIIFSGSTPTAIFNRAKALKESLNNTLATNLANKFNPNEYGGDKEPFESKKFFCELILNNPDKKDEITELWDQLFPGDQKWLNRVNPVYFERMRRIEESNNSETE